MIDPTYPLYPVLWVVSLVALLAPSPWHFKTRNTGTVLFICWTTLGGIIYGINSIVWSGSLENYSPFWCDLTTKFMVALSVALPSCSLIINMRLYYIATIKQVKITSSDHRKRTIIDLSIGLGFPLLMFPIHYVNQGHRYDIIENIGCYPSTYVTPVSMVTIFIWPILLSLISAVYAILAIRSFLRQRQQFTSVLQSANSNLTVNRYFRLLALAGTSVVCTIPLSLYIFVFNCLVGISPWISWADTKLNFNRVEYYPYQFFMFSPRTLFMVNISRYALASNGFFFFIFFGLAGESGVFYRKAFWKVAGLFGFQPKPVVTPGASWIARPGASNGLTSSIPGFVTVTSQTQTTSTLPPKKTWSSTESTTSSSDPEDYDEKIDDSSSMSPPRLPEQSYQLDSPSRVGHDVV